jgi:ketosteroid isomerase-like protein
MSEQTPDMIRKVAMDFDNAIEAKNIEAALSAFSPECEIELFGTKLYGLENARKWINWLYMHLDQIEFEPVTIIVKGNIFFEEFIVHGTLHNGKQVKSKQAEILIYENYKIKSLRIYFDRLDFMNSLVDGFIAKRIVKSLINRSLEGLV